ncbi:HK97 gp10 family phage protein [Gracilibacillus saliphilus]|uniref:HK97 gp10 family phage protein n=1 Tax=Gracilibacillus saliphilus TaxID=543890 RepID=UPI0013D6F66A|nr:HK97 gp10 family phage protein [Gracilibacillus saliphilus]
MELDFSDLAKEFENASDSIEDVLEENVNVISEDLLSQSVELAPLDEGGLRENGSVEPAKKNGNVIESQVGYSKEYALRMHEDVYTPQTPGTGRKYLEKPTNENAERYSEFLSQKMGDAFK